MTIPGPRVEHFKKYKFGNIPCFKIPEITIYLGSVTANENNGKSVKWNQKPEVGICKLCRL